MDKKQLQNIRDEFPILNRKINGEELVYFDNSATSLMPTKVNKTVSEFNLQVRANVHRSTNSLSLEATNRYEAARQKVQTFINARQSKEVIFTAGCTDSINLVASTFGEENIQAGDEILISIMEHHSNLIPWQQLAKRKHAVLKYINLTKNGELDVADFKNKLSSKTKIVAITHVSNVLGTINPVKKLTDLAHKFGAVVLVDGAQAAGHLPIDVQDLDADFYAFSGHKMFGPDGIGVLYCKQKFLQTMPPYRFGGEMIEHVDRFESSWAQLPQKFEAGTPNIAGAIGLASAIDFINEIGLAEIQARERKLLEYLEPKLANISNLEMYGSNNLQEKSSIISFNIQVIHPHDIATALDLAGIEIRAGHHCAEPLMQELGVESTARVSLAFFNTFSECDRLIAALKQTKEFFIHESK